MNKITAYARLLRIPGLGALAIPPVIGAITVGVINRDVIRKYIGIQSFLRYSLVPIMLIPIIGIVPSVILIFFPIAWYIIFAPLIGEKLFRPRM